MTLLKSFTNLRHFGQNSVNGTKTRLHEIPDLHVRFYKHTFDWFKMSSDLCLFVGTLLHETMVMPFNVEILISQSDDRSKVLRQICQ